MKKTKFYEVENIIDKRINKGKPEYLIKWKGYSINESTWEPLSHLKYIKDSIKEFEEKNKNINKNGKKNEESKENKNKENRQFIGKKRNNNENEIINIEENKSQLMPIFKIDESLKKILIVKLDNNTLSAIVEKKNKKGESIKEYMSTNKIKKMNPWILIEYYESKLKFA